MSEYKYGRDARWTGEANTYITTFSGTEKQRKEQEKAWKAFFARHRRKRKTQGKHRGKTHGGHRSHT